MDLNGIFTTIVSLDRKFAWSMFGVLIAGIGIFLVYSPPSRHIEIDIQSLNNVFDLHNPIEDLTVTFQGEDIRKLRQNLKMYTIQVSNTGWGDFKQNDFDENEQWGIVVSNAKIIKAELKSEDAYLDRNVRQAQVFDDKILFPKVMFDKGTSFAANLLVIHREEESPAIDFTGKISGMSKIRIQNSWKDKGIPGVITYAFSGDLKIQVIRLVVYGVAALFLLVSLLLSYALLQEKLSEKLRNFRERKISIFATEFSTVHGIEIVVDRYISDGTKGLRQLSSSLQEKDLSQVAEKLAPKGKVLPKVEKIQVIQEIGELARVVLGLIERNSLVRRPDGEWELNSKFMSSIDALIEKLN